MSGVVASNFALIVLVSQRFAKGFSQSLQRSGGAAIAAPLRPLREIFFLLLLAGGCIENEVLP